MLDLKDFFHLPEVDVLLAQVVDDPRGITVVAGRGSHLAQSAGPARIAPAVVSDRSTIAALLMRHILDHDFYGRQMRAAVIGTNRNALPVANHQRAQIEFVSAPIDQVDGFTTGLQQAMMRDPDLLAVERLNTVTAQASFHAAATGRRILTQIDTALIGGEVLHEIVGLGCSPSQMSLVAWVVAVQHVPTLCTYCKQPHQPGETLIGTMAERHNLDPTSTFYAASGCRHCEGTGYIGELTAFDIYRVHGGVASFSELVSTPSLLPLDGYLARLAAYGYVPLEDAVRLGGSAPGKAAPIALERESAPDKTARTLQRKLAELEAANKVLAQRVDELISLEEASRAVSASVRLNDLAGRIVRYACELGGADRAILYLARPSDSGRVLAVDGWQASLVGAVVRLPPSMLAAGDPDSVVGAPPGIELSPDQLQTLQAGLRVPLVADGAPIGVLIVNSLYKTRFAPSRVTLLKSLADHAAASIRRAREVDALRDQIAYLEAARTGLIDRARHDRECELARDLQLNSLPGRFPAIDPMRFAAACRPAPEVGSDAYDVIDLGDGHLGLLIADVAGRGLPAAYHMGLARSLIRAEAQRSRSPRQVLAAVNRVLGEVAHGDVFLTAFYGILEVATRHLVYCRAGHARPLWLRADGHDVLLGTPGMPIGMFDSGELDLGEGEIFLSQGDALILYTDGMTDALDPYGAEFGVTHWVKQARERADLPADQLCTALFDEVAAFQAGAPQVDDMALLVLRVENSATSPIASESTSDR